MKGVRTTLYELTFPVVTRQANWHCLNVANLNWHSIADQINGCYGNQDMTHFYWTTDKEKETVALLEKTKELTIITIKVLKIVVHQISLAFPLKKKRLLYTCGDPVRPRLLPGAPGIEAEGSPPKDHKHCLEKKTKKPAKSNFHPHTKTISCNLLDMHRIYSV